MVLDVIETQLTMSNRHQYLRPEEHQPHQQIDILGQCINIFQYFFNAVLHV